MTSIQEGYWNNVLIINAIDSTQKKRLSRVATTAGCGKVNLTKIHCQCHTLGILSTPQTSHSQNIPGRESYRQSTVRGVNIQCQIDLDLDS